MDLPVLIHYLEMGLIVMVGSSFLIWVICDIIRTKRQDSIPVFTDMAVAYYKHPEYENTPVRTTRGIRNEGTYYITFHTEHGEAVKLYMSGQDFFRIQEDDVGQLTWQGDKFWKFIPKGKEP